MYDFQPVAFLQSCFRPATSCRDFPIEFHGYAVCFEL